jgi:hypothetical protein
MKFTKLLKGCAALLILSSAALTGCTSVRVNAVAAEHRIDHICIQNNPRVIVSDFVAVMQEGFQAHGISSQLVTTPAQARCLFTATYTARRSWDFATYLTEAQIDILRDGRQIASANYHLKGKGGFALNKWAGTRTKILPVIDQLLAHVNPGNRQVVAAGIAAAPLEKVSASSEQPSPELARKLAELKDAFDVQLITQEEYEAKRKSLIETL